MRIKSQVQSDQAKKNLTPGRAVSGKSESGPLDQFVRIRWCQRSDVSGLKKRTPLWLRGSP